MKALLYCCKSKPYLNDCKLINPNKRYFISNKGIWSIDLSTQQTYSILNGKIVGECDYEIEKIKGQSWQSDATRWYSSELLEKSCLHVFEIDNYLKGKEGYAIHIKNLHIFDKPRELNNKVEPVFTILNVDEYENMHCDCCYSNKDCKKCYYHYNTKEIVKAPQNMCKVFYRDDDMKILISIRPELMCKVLNGECTIIVKKKVLKEMIK